MKKILVLGAGNIGSLIAFLFSREDDYSVILCDKAVPDAAKVSGTVTNVDASVTDDGVLQHLIDMHKPNVIVSALPYSCNIHVSTIASENSIHYYDLTEDVDVKNHILKLAEKSNSILMPQCGLAPGFINIVGNHLMEQLDVVHSAKLRVGALPQQVSNAFNYALTWSTNGLINEYGNPCEAIVNNEVVDNLQPLEGLEKLLVEGIEYEAFNTSGGLGTLAETWGGQVVNLNYKTLRYPGHCEKIKFLMMDMKLNNHRDELETMLERSIPVTTQDVIVIYSSATGLINDKFVEKTYVNRVYPLNIDGFAWTGIQVTTAAGICAAVDITLGGDFGGFVKQEALDFKEFINNRFGRFYKVI